MKNFRKGKGEGESLWDREICAQLSKRCQSARGPGLTTARFVPFRRAGSVTPEGGEQRRGIVRAEPLHQPCQEKILGRRQNCAIMPRRRTGAAEGKTKKKKSGHSALGGTKEKKEWPSGLGPYKR